MLSTIRFATNVGVTHREEGVEAIVYAIEYGRYRRLFMGKENKTTYWRRPLAPEGLRILVLYLPRLEWEGGGQAHFQDLRTAWRPPES